MPWVVVGHRSINHVPTTSVSYSQSFKHSNPTYTLSILTYPPNSTVLLHPRKSLLSIAIAIACGLWIAIACRFLSTLSHVSLPSSWILGIVSRHSCDRNHFCLCVIVGVLVEGFSIVIEVEVVELSSLEVASPYHGIVVEVEVVELSSWSLSWLSSVLLWIRCAQWPSWLRFSGFVFVMLSCFIIPVVEVAGSLDAAVPMATRKNVQFDLFTSRMDTHAHVNVIGGALGSSCLGMKSSKVIKLPSFTDVVGGVHLLYRFLLLNLCRYTKVFVDVDLASFVMFGGGPPISSTYADFQEAIEVISLLPIDSMVLFLLGINLSFKLCGYIMRILRLLLRTFRVLSIDFGSLAEVIPKVVTEDDNLALTKVPTFDEVKQVVFISSDMVVTVQSFFLSGVVHPVVNLEKSHMYFGFGISHARWLKILELIGMNVGSLPFTYLGVHFFEGSPTLAVLHPIADRILEQLADWKGCTLSIVGRLC
ncbi:hypothetical protein FNV43_RR24519 [Rhamnella rubrinervis]|uniref:Uncharacterized protein n=1 Tax=Rhamnella rubrinervis TaxID=2594499 RepID=A0A8K0DY87_9ROSA|nr:hypothetical protein FNV43_RR24519 [Rhamnella rubrinervis]